MPRSYEGNLRANLLSATLFQVRQAYAMLTT